MHLALVLIAASAAGSPDSAWVGRILLAVNEEAAAPQGKADTTPEAQDTKIEHTPMEKTPRGLGVFIKAKVGDPSHLFTPLVFARKAGTSRYEAFTMKDKGKKGFRAYLPPSILSEGSFEYFIEAQHEEGGATRLGSPRKPFNCVAFDPPPLTRTVEKPEESMFTTARRPTVRTATAISTSGRVIPRCLAVARLLMTGTRGP